MLKLWNCVVGVVLAVAIVVLAACGCENSENTQTPTPINANFFDGELEIGYYCFCWDQYYDENRATAGEYKLRMSAGEFDITHNFTIKQSGPTRTPPECCDTATSSIITIDKIAKDPPEFFGAVLDTNSYTSGDTVHVEIAVPVKARVKLEISPISTK